QRRDGLEEGGVEEAEILVHPASGLRGVAADQAVPLDVRAARAQLEAPERTERVAYHALRRADHVAGEDVDPGRLLLPAHANAEEAARHVAIERDLLHRHAEVGARAKEVVAGEERGIGERA